MRHAREMRRHVRKMKHTFETRLIAINAVGKSVDREAVVDAFCISVKTPDGWLLDFERDGINDLRRRASIRSGA